MKFSDLLQGLVVQIMNQKIMINLEKGIKTSPFKLINYLVGDITEEVKVFNLSVEKSIDKAHETIADVKDFIECILNNSVELSSPEGQVFLNKPLIKGLFEIYNNIVKSCGFISLKNNGIEPYQKALVSMRKRLAALFGDISKNRPLTALVRVLSLFFSHAIAARKNSQAFMAYNRLCRVIPSLNIFSNTLEVFLKSRWIKLSSVAKYSKCLLRKELDLWGSCPAVPMEQETFNLVKVLINNKDIDFVIVAREYTLKQAQRKKSETWKKYLDSRYNSYVNIVDKEKNKTLKGRDPKKGVVKIEEFDIDTLDSHSKGILDPLSRNLAIKGLYYNSRNPYFGDSLVIKIEEPNKKATWAYKVDEAMIQEWAAYNISVHSQQSFNNTYGNVEGFSKVARDIIKYSATEFISLYM
jgi:hypothetical protein